MCKKRDDYRKIAHKHNPVQRKQNPRLWIVDDRSIAPYDMDRQCRYHYAEKPVYGGRPINRQRWGRGHDGIPKPHRYPDIDPGQDNDFQHGVIVSNKGPFQKQIATSAGERLPDVIGGPQFAVLTTIASEMRAGARLC